MQTDLAESYIIIGLLLVFSLAANWLGKATRTPRVTLLILLGFAIGPSGLDAFAGAHQTWLEIFASLALSMLGFLLGGRLTVASLREQGTLITVLSVGATLITLIVVFAGLTLLGLPIHIALILGALATATDPAATLDVIEETGLSNRFTDNVVGIVTLDDVWGLMAFSLCVAMTFGIAGDAQGWSTLLHGLREVAGSILLGAALGVPLAFITGRIQEGAPTLVEALGAILLCSGIAIQLELSYLLACMSMGTVVSNLARHHRYPFHAIEGIEWPFMLLFFVLAGAAFDWTSLAHIGWLGLAFILLRGLGKIMGGCLSAQLAGLGIREGFFYGATLLPQAGVAMGMALIASHYYPEFTNLILNLTIGSTVIYELLGPICTRWALASQSRQPQTGEQ